MAPSVSVVLPARNEERRIGTALDSLFAQSLTDWELVVVDDGSTDGTRAAVEACGDARVRVVSIPPSGIAAALNVGIAAAGAPLVARMDADDHAHPQRLERQVAFLREHPEVAVLGTAWDEVDADGRTLTPRVAFVGGRLNEALPHRNPITHASVVLRRDVVLALGGYDEGLTHSTEDWDLWLRVAATGATLWNLDEVLATRVMTGENTAAKIERAQVAEELVVRTRDIRRRRRAGEPVGRHVVRLAQRAPVVLAPLPLKRAVRRAQGKG